jgi:hypothetical protein
MRLRPRSQVRRRGETTIAPSLPTVSATAPSYDARGDYGPPLGLNQWNWTPSSTPSSVSAATTSFVRGSQRGTQGSSSSVRSLPKSSIPTVNQPSDGGRMTSRWQGPAP